MKRMILICSMVALAGMAQAQTVAMGGNAWDGGGTAKKFNNTLLRPANEFEGVSMSFNDGNAVFSNIPETKKALWAVVTNADGDFIKQMKLTPEQNIMELRRLHTGLYFVTIIYKGKSKKAFTISI